MKSFINSNIEVGQRILQKRLVLDYTREQIADQINISPGYLASIENGQQPLPLSVAEQLCLLFDTTFDYWYLGLQKPDSPSKADPADDNTTIKTALFDLITGSSEEECEGYLEVLKAVRNMPAQK